MKGSTEINTLWNLALRADQLVIMLCKGQTMISIRSRKKMQDLALELKERKLYRLKSHMRTDNIKFFRKRNARRLRINTSPARGLTEKTRKRKLFARWKLEEVIRPWITDVISSVSAADSGIDSWDVWFRRKARRCNGIVIFKRKLCWRLDATTS